MKIMTPQEMHHTTLEYIYPKVLRTRVVNTATIELGLLSWVRIKSHGKWYMLKVRNQTELTTADVKSSTKYNNAVDHLYEAFMHNAHTAMHLFTASKKSIKELLKDGVLAKSPYPFSERSRLYQQQ